MKKTPNASFINRISQLNGKTINGKIVLCATFDFGNYGIEFDDEDESVLWIMSVENESMELLEKAIGNLTIN